MCNALDWAKQAGYAVPDDTAPVRFMRASLTPTLNLKNKVEIMEYLTEKGYPIQDTSWLPMDAYRTYPYTASTPIDISTYLSITRILQLSGLAYDLATVEKMKRHTILGATYWDHDGVANATVASQRYQTTLKAYKIYRDAGKTDALSSIQQFLLGDDPFYPKQREGYERMNTYEKSMFIQTVLPDITKKEGVMDAAKVSIPNFREDTLHFTQFPVTTIFDGNLPQMMDVHTQRELPVFISASQQWWDENPPPASSGFTIKTQFVQAGKTVEYLSTSLPAILQATITVDADAQYALIELPVPAGCSYGTKVFGESSVETHREYLRDRVAIFCDYIEKGLIILRYLSNLVL
ncbi:MAG: hypothetical protein R2795_23635 [Saprospiraceae bacterium]